MGEILLIKIILLFISFMVILMLNMFGTTAYHGIRIFLLFKDRNEQDKPKNKKRQKKR